MTNNSPYEASRICGICAKNEGADVALTILDPDGGRRQLLLTMEQYLELKVKKGEELDEERLAAIESASAFCEAFRCGEALLAYAPAPTLALARKIAQRGHKREVSMQAAVALSQKGLIDERAMIRREVQKCARKYWGGRRIRSYLWTRGYGENALGTLDDLLLEYEFSELCAALLQKHYARLPDDPEERKKLKAKLVRYGYTPEEIRGAFQILSH